MKGIRGALALLPTERDTDPAINPFDEWLLAAGWDAEPRPEQAVAVLQLRLDQDEVGVELPPPARRFRVVFRTCDFPLSNVNKPGRAEGVLPQRFSVPANDRKPLCPKPSRVAGARRARA